MASAPILSALSELSALRSLSLVMQWGRVVPAAGLELLQLEDLQLRWGEFTGGLLEILQRSSFPRLERLEMKMEGTNPTSSHVMPTVANIIAKRFRQLQRITIITATSLQFSDISSLALHGLTHFTIQLGNVFEPLMIVSPEALCDFLCRSAKLQVLQIYSSFTNLTDAEPVLLKPFEVLEICSQFGKQLRVLKLPLMLLPDVVIPEATTATPFQKLETFHIPLGIISVAQVPKMAKFLHQVLPPGCKLIPLDLSSGSACYWAGVWIEWCKMRDPSELRSRDGSSYQMLYNLWK